MNIVGARFPKRKNEDTSGSQDDASIFVSTPCQSLLLEVANVSICYDPDVTGISNLLQ